MSAPEVVVLDYGSGNVRSAVRALQRAGARVTLTADPGAATGCDGLVVPGVGAFAAVAAGLRAVHGDRIIERRVAGARPVLAICVGLQVMFDRSVEFEDGRGTAVPGLGEWPGTVQRLKADVVPHMGWNTVEVPPGTRLFAGIETERFYFVHSFGVQQWQLPAPGEERGPFRAPLVTWATHGVPFVAAVEHGALSATQFHPEKSGEAGTRLLRNWLESL